MSESDDGRGRGLARGGDRAFPLERIRLELSNSSKIVDWMEVPKIPLLLNGENHKSCGVIGQNFLPKKIVFSTMLVYLHVVGFLRDITTGENLHEQFDRYIVKYKLAVEVRNQTGSGLIEEEARADIILSDKLEEMCPYFERLNALLY